MEATCGIFKGWFVFSENVMHFNTYISCFYLSFCYLFFFNYKFNGECLTCAPPTGTGIVMYCWVLPPAKNNK